MSRKKEKLLHEIFLARTDPTLVNEARRNTNHYLDSNTRKRKYRGML
jgi:hypothetical protein